MKDIYFSLHSLLFGVYLHSYQLLRTLHNPKSKTCAAKFQSVFSGDSKFKNVAKQILRFKGIKSHIKSCFQNAKILMPFFAMSTSQHRLQQLIRCH